MLDFYPAILAAIISSQGGLIPSNQTEFSFPSQYYSNFHVDHEWNNGQEYVQYEVDKLSFSSDKQFSYGELILENGKFVMDTDYDIGYSLDNGQWVAESSTSITVVSKDNKTVTIDDLHQLKIESVEDIKGEEVKIDGSDVTVIMPENTQLITLSHEILKNNYSLYKQASSHGHTQNEYYLSLSEVIEYQCGTHYFTHANEKNNVVGISFNCGEEAQTSGSLVGVKYDNSLVENVGTWEIAKLEGSNIDALLVTINKAYNDENDNPLYSVKDGDIWRGWYDLIGSKDTINVYNQEAFDAISKRMVRMAGMETLFTTKMIEGKTFYLTSQTDSGELRYNKVTFNDNGTRDFYTYNPSTNSYTLLNTREYSVDVDGVLQINQTITGYTGTLNIHIVENDGVFLATEVYAGDTKWVDRWIFNSEEEALSFATMKTSKLQEALDYLGSINPETDNIENVISETKSILDSADIDDKDALVAKALLELAEISNSTEVENLITISLDNPLYAYTNNLPKLLQDNNSLVATLMSNITDLSITSTTLIHNISMKLKSISDTLGEAFVNGYRFNFDGMTITANQVKLLRASILLASSNLEYMASFSYLINEDIETREITVGGITAEYTNITSDPVPILERTDVYTLSDATRLTNAKILFLASIEQLKAVDAILEVDISSEIIKIQAEAVKIENSVKNGVAYIVGGDNPEDYEKFYFNLRAIYDSATVLDKEHTIGSEFEYVSDTSYYESGKNYEAGAYHQEISRFYNEPMSNEWVASDGSKISYDGGWPAPYVWMEPTAIPTTASSSHVDDVLIKIELIPSGVIYTGDALLNYLNE